ncbi:MAG: efflux RND transporter periplasmic adaptor subunit [Phycisphaerales bacterium]
MRALIWISTVAAVGGGGAVVFHRTSTIDAPAFVEETLYPVTRGTLRVTITENGTLMAQNSEKITPRTRRSGKITFLVEEGKAVEEGEVLCRLDTTDLEQRKQELDLSIVQTQANLDTAQTELDIQNSENTATIEKAHITLEKAEKELERYREGDGPKERRQLEIAIKEARTNFSRAKKKYEDSLMLYEQNYINKSEVEQDEIEFERSEIQLTSAERDLDIFEKYTYPMTMMERETAVKDAERSLENAEKRAQSTLRQKEVAVESQEQQLQNLQSHLDEVIEEIENFTIAAPSPGIVIYGDPSQPWYRSEIKLGGSIWGGFTLFTIPDLRVMQVRVQIHEADINKVTEGLPVTVTMDTYPGLTLTGQVTKIASIAGAGDNAFGGSDEVKKFTVDITLESDDELQLKPGISAKAEIFVEELTDVLFAPIQCVFLEDGAHYCYVMDDAGLPSRRPVEVGTNNNSFIEIRDGLSEAARVLLYNPNLHATAAPETDNEEEAISPIESPGVNGAAPEP